MISQVALCQTVPKWAVVGNKRVCFGGVLAKVILSLVDSFARGVRYLYEHNTKLKKLYINITLLTLLYNSIIKHTIFFFSEKYHPEMRVKSPNLSSLIIFKLKPSP